MDRGYQDCTIDSREMSYWALDVRRIFSEYFEVGYIIVRDSVPRL